MKVTILDTEADDFESYISAYLSELKDFENSGADLDDISLAELLYKLKDLFDIRDVEFPNIPEDIVEDDRNRGNTDGLVNEGRITQSKLISMTRVTSGVGVFCWQEKRSAFR